MKRKKVYDESKVDRMLSSGDRLKVILRAMQYLTQNEGEGEGDGDGAHEKLRSFQLEELILTSLSVVETKARELGVQGMADQGDVVQALVALLHNALDEAKKHEQKFVKIKILSSPEENFIFIELSNSGPCLNIEETEKFFRPFYTTKEINEGTGLGLTVARAVITSLGGDLYFKTHECPCCVIKLKRSPPCE